MGVHRRVFLIDRLGFTVWIQLQWWTSTIFIESVTNRRFPFPSPFLGTCALTSLISANAVERLVPPSSQNLSKQSNTSILGLSDFEMERIGIAAAVSFLGGVIQVSGTEMWGWEIETVAKERQLELYFYSCSWVCLFRWVRGRCVLSGIENTYSISTAWVNELELIYWSYREVVFEFLKINFLKSVFPFWLGTLAHRVVFTLVVLTVQIFEWSLVSYTDKRERLNSSPEKKNYWKVFSPKRQNKLITWIPSSS